MIPGLAVKGKHVGVTAIRVLMNDNTNVTCWPDGRFTCLSRVCREERNTGSCQHVELVKSSGILNDDVGDQLGYFGYMKSA